MMGCGILWSPEEHFSRLKHNMDIGRQERRRACTLKIRSLKRRFKEGVKIQKQGDF
jgi:hypothetical protein